MRTFVIVALVLAACSVEGRYVDNDAQITDAGVVDSDPNDPDADPSSPDAREPSLYVFVKEVAVPDIIVGSESAASVAADSGTVFVGTPNKGDGGVMDIFVKSASDWVRGSPMTGTGADRDASFGRDIVIRGNTMIVVADEQPKNSVYKAGGIFVFNRRGAVWEQVTILNSVHAAPFNLWGKDAATDGARIIAGRERTDGAPPGEIDVFEKTGELWVAQTPIVTPVGFGRIVGIEGDIIATGSLDGNQVILFGRVDRTWTETSRLTGPASSKFGSSVVLRGNLLFVGAPDDAGIGAVFVYELVGSSWTEKAKLVPPTEGSAGGKFGASLAFASGVLVIGAPETNGQGAAYLFEGAGREWFRHPRLTAMNGIDDGNFGSSVAVAEDASTFVVGALGSQRTFIYERVLR